MTSKNRKRIASDQRRRLFQRNADRCCVCKESRVGLHLHHLDHDPSNNVDDNIAVLCVRDHDRHHRPAAYITPSHLELGARRIMERKMSWEAFVAEAKTPNPKVLAVISLYGERDFVHSGKLAMQWADGRIEYEKTYHVLASHAAQWPEEMLKEVTTIGKRIKVVFVDGLLPVTYCECCQSSTSRVLNAARATRLTDPQWNSHSICAVYVNLDEPVVTATFSLKDKLLYSWQIHRCTDTLLHCQDDETAEQVLLRRSPSVRTQVTRIVQKLLRDWAPAQTIFGSGDPANPHFIKGLKLPRLWEERPCSSGKL